MKQRDKLKEILDEIHKLAEESVPYLPKLESLDHEEKEPLIKDEMICKIIRAWASENDSTSVVYYSSKNELVDSYGNVISFNLIFDKLKYGVEYTIDELCGEENECES